MPQAILRIIILTDLAILRFSNNYYAELAISFLPYIIGMLFVGMIISFINLRKYLKKTNIKAIQRNMWGLLLVGFGILFIIQSNTFNSFYNYKIPTSTRLDDFTTGGPSTNLKVLYANIHKDNTNYSGIEMTIQQANPDLILFVEFSENHYDHLKEFLKKNYPYINSTSWSKKFIGSMVFSKYKIENRADDFSQGRRRYAYFSLQSNKGFDQYFYLIHTSSPDSYEHFEIRNQQLKSFLSDVDMHQAGYRADKDKVYIIGDFNISPRSSYYKEFQKGLGSGFVNATRLFPIAFTRKFIQLPLFRSHIDHVRTKNIGTIQDIKTIEMPGSDHRGITFTINN